MIILKRILKIIKNKIHFLESFVLSVIFGFPIKKLKVIFVTGTDGKTTTSNILYQTLNKLGKKTALISTTGAKIGEKNIETGFHTTTPSRVEIQKILQNCVKNKMEYVVTEYTAHGVEQNRIICASPIATIYTNITNKEHLDYFENFENYKKAKAKLIKISKSVIINKHGTSSNYLIEKTKKYKVKTALYEKFDIEKLVSKNFIEKFPGDYNLENASAVFKLCFHLNFEKSKIIKAINSSTPPEGRYEIVNKNPRIIVDFAHTPNALKQVLKITRKTTVGKLILVFGCAGDRDRSKRKEMGKISAKYADIVILTAEDPRNESLKEINNEIQKGFRLVNTKSQLIRFDDQKIKTEVRLNALKKAILLAKSNDTILITGKGHEKSLCFGKKEYPWNDKKGILKILQKSI